MAYDRDETEYTLTEEGWKVGDDREHGIEVWVCQTYQASGWSREYVSWRCVWANQGIPREERNKVRNKHKEFLGTPGRYGDRETTIGMPL